MALQVVQLVYDEGLYGVGIVNTVTGCPLPISAGTLADTDDAEDFLNWLSSHGHDARRMSARELEEQGSAWFAGEGERYRCQRAAMDALEDASR